MAVVSVQSKKLLKRVAGYYRHSLTADSKGLAYLRDDLQVHHNKVIEDLFLGYSDGTLTGTLPADRIVISRLQELGILDQHNNERLKNSLVVPLVDAAGDVVNLYAIDVKSRASRMIGQTAGGINRRAFAAFDAAVICASVSDLLVLYDRGAENCAFVHPGKNGDADWLPGSLSNLKQVLLLGFGTFRENPDLEHLLAHFKEKAIAACRFSLPGQSAASFFRQNTYGDFKQLLKRCQRQHLSAAGKTRRPERSTCERTGEGFVYIADNKRRYEIKGIAKQSTCLKVAIKASLTARENAPFELSTVDLYSYRARIWFAGLCADLFTEPEDSVQADLHRILEHAERFHATERKGAVRISAARRKAAMAFLTDPNLFGHLLADFEAMGIVGEQTNKLVGYLAAVSRKLDEPLSVLIQSRSAAGKSTLQDALVRLMPQEDVVKYTRITDQALFYAGQSRLSHKLLAIEEGAGMKGAAYAIRCIQTAGAATMAAAANKPGVDGLQTREYTVKGPATVMLTTTAASLDEETASRFIVLAVDESTEMTRAIHARHRLQETLDGLMGRRRMAQLVDKHRCAQRLLKPVAVVNPYAVHLKYPCHRLKARRDFRKYLGLIRSIAFLHQHQRVRKSVSVDGTGIVYIEVTLADIEHANALAAAVLLPGLDDLPASSRKLMDKIAAMAAKLATERGLPPAKVSITRRMIREHTGWSNWQVRQCLPPLLDRQYLVLQPGSRVNCHRYEVNAAEIAHSTDRTDIQLTPVSELQRKAAGCVRSCAEGKNDDNQLK